MGDGRNLEGGKEENLEYIQNNYLYYAYNKS